MEYFVFMVLNTSVYRTSRAQAAFFQRRFAGLACQTCPRLVFELVS